MRDYGGVFPTDAVSLRALPGIGPYTASAVLAFAFNAPSVLIETNVRTVYLHHFFPHAEAVSDSELLPIIAATLDTENPRTWYAALMDYGSHLKATVGNKNIQSRHYTKQSKFAGSDRQVRGVIIRTLSQAKTSLTLPVLAKQQGAIEPERLTQLLQKLITENMVQRVGSRYSLPQ